MVGEADRKPVRRTGFGAGMFRSPIRTTGSSTTVRFRRIRRSWRDPSRARTTGGCWPRRRPRAESGRCRSPPSAARRARLITLRGPVATSGSGVRSGAAGGSARTSTRGSGTAGRPVRRRPGRSSLRSPPSRSRPAFRRAPPTNRCDTRPHRLRGDRGQVGQVRPRLHPIDLLEREDVGVQGATATPAGPIEHPVLGGPTVQDVECCQPHTRKVATIDHDDAPRLCCPNRPAADPLAGMEAGRSPCRRRCVVRLGPQGRPRAVRPGGELRAVGVRRAGEHTRRGPCGGRERCRAGGRRARGRRLRRRAAAGGLAVQGVQRWSRGRRLAPIVGEPIGAERRRRPSITMCWASGCPSSFRPR